MCLDECGRLSGNNCSTVEERRFSTIVVLASGRDLGWKSAPRSTVEERRFSAA